MTNWTDEFEAHVSFITLHNFSRYSLMPLPPCRASLEINKKKVNSAGRHKLGYLSRIADAEKKRKKGRKKTSLFSE